MMHTCVWHDHFSHVEVHGIPFALISILSINIWAMTLGLSNAGILTSTSCLILVVLKCLFTGKFLKVWEKLVQSLPMAAVIGEWCPQKMLSLFFPATILTYISNVWFYILRLWGVYSLNSKWTDLQSAVSGRAGTDWVRLYEIGVDDLTGPNWLHKDQWNLLWECIPWCRWGG